MEQVAAVPLVNARPETDGSIGVAVEVLHHLPGKPDGVPVIGVQHDRRTTVSALGRGHALGVAVPGVMSVLRRPVDERIVRHQRALKQMARRHGRDRRRRAHAAVEHLNSRRVQRARVDVGLVEGAGQRAFVRGVAAEAHGRPFRRRVEEHILGPLLVAVEVESKIRVAASTGPVIRETEVMELSPVDCAAQVNDLPPAHDLELALNGSGAEAKCLLRILYRVARARRSFG